MDPTNGLERVPDAGRHNGATLAYLNLPWPNGAWPKLAAVGCDDGIFARIYRHPDGFVADGNATRPDWSRKQYNVMRLVATYDEAVAVLAEWFPWAVIHCANPITEETCPYTASVHVKGRTEWPRDNKCRECGWQEVPFRYRPRSQAGHR